MQKSEIAFLNPVVATSLGFSYASAGRYEEADAILGTALEQYQRTGLKYGIAYASLNLASVAFQKGDAERMAKLLAQVIELATTYGFAGVQVAALRLRAMASGLGRAPDYNSRRDAAQALALAEKKKMGPDIGHSYLALARLCGKAGDRDAAKRHALHALSLYHKMGMTEWFERASKLL